MTLLAYLKAKVSEYSIILQRIETQIFRFDNSKFPHHTLLFDSLKHDLSIAKQYHKELEAIVKISDPLLLARGFEKLHLIEYRIYSAVYLYFPALRGEGSPELAIREILLSILQNLSLVWIQDLIVRLDDQLATITELKTPIFFAPPTEKVSFLEMPGFYHEIGHNFFRRFEKDILSTLRTEVNTHFSFLTRQAGNLSPNQARTFKEAALYWNDERLEEIFCDIFGTWACGIAHYTSCVDMSLLFRDNPYEIFFDDEHPPMAARVYVCWKALTQEQKSETITQITDNSWAERLSAWTPNSNFRLICAEDLLDKLVVVSTDKIEEFLPTTKRYNSPLPATTDAIEFEAGITFEDILNRAAQILLLFPEEYLPWESSVLKSLGISSYSGSQNDSKM